MRSLPKVISLFTVLFFVFSLSGNVLITDPAFTSIAFADDNDKDKNKNKLKGNKRLHAAVTDLQRRVAGLEVTDPNPRPPTKTGAKGADGLAGDNGADAEDVNPALVDSIQANISDSQADITNLHNQVSSNIIGSKTRLSNLEVLHSESSRSGSG